MLSDRSITVQKSVENAKNQNVTFWVIFKQRVVVTLKNDWNSFDFLRSEMSTPDKDLDTRKVIMTINQFRMILSDLQRIRETLLWWFEPPRFFFLSLQKSSGHIYLSQSVLILHVRTLEQDLIFGPKIKWKVEFSDILLSISIVFCAKIHNNDLWIF